MASRQDGDLYIHGNLSAKTMTLPVNSVTNASVLAAAGIAATKLDHRHPKHYAQSGVAVAATIPLHVARAAGKVKQVDAASIVACTGNATITIDLKKNGVTVLNATIVLDSTNVARTIESGTVSVVDYVAGDFFEVVVTVNAGTGVLGSGLIVQAELDEAAVQN